MTDDDLSPFDAGDEPDLVYMCHDSGVPAPIPRAAVAAWKAKGWRECDPPADVDPALAEHMPITAPAAQPEPTTKKKTAAGDPVKENTDA